MAAQDGGVTDLQQLVSTLSTNDLLKFEEITGYSVTDFGRDDITYGNSCRMICAMYLLLRGREGHEEDIGELLDRPPETIVDELRARIPDSLDPPSSSGESSVEEPANDDSNASSASDATTTSPSST